MQDSKRSWFPDSLNDADSEAYWRARLIVVATLLVGALAAFSAFLHGATGSTPAAVHAIVLFCLLPIVPLVLRYSDNVVVAANILAGIFFLSLTSVNVLSAGRTPAAQLVLVLVPILALAAPGRATPTLWTVLVLIELALVPHFESFGFPVLLETNPEIAARAVHRLPILIVLFILGAGLATEKILRDARRQRHEAELDLAAVSIERERLESEMVKRRENLVAVGTLAAGVAHQINNPVGSILASAQLGLLSQNESEPAGRQTLETIEAEAQRCGRIVKALLKFSRGEHAEKWSEDFNRVVQTAYHAALPYAQARGAKLDLELTPETVHVRLSPIELEQAIVNLVHNAIESRALDAHVIVKTVFSEDHARVEVIDNGPGISTGEIERIFQPFYTTRQQEGGSGLGLSVVKGVVEDHFGEIAVRPGEHDIGSVFAIELPRNAV